MDFKDTFFSRKSAVNCRGILLDLTTPKVMGILNHTPDSFYDGGRYMKEKQIVERIEKLAGDGADIIDVGGYSSRPGASEVPFEEEKKRLKKVLQLIFKTNDKMIVSVDSFRPEIAAFAVEEFGVTMINDISAGLPDNRMLENVARLGLPYIMMHMKGNPQTMQINPVYENLMEDIIAFFMERISTAREYGIHDIIIDPGFGFGKTHQQNFEILRKLNAFDVLELPVLVGISRKSMIYKTLGINSEEALNGTSVLHALALANGANMLRVHDVKEAREAIRLFEAYKGS